MDLIERNVLKVNFDDIMIHGVVDTNGCITPMVEHKAVVELIDWMPTVDAKPVKRAKWVKYLSIYRCSNCGSPKGIKKPYCEICGACMDGSSDKMQNEQKYGAWAWEPGYVGTTAKCSVCGLSPMGFYSLPINQIGRLPEYKYCPNCGAFMGGDADE